MLRPSTREVEQAIQNAEIYVDGIRKLFADFNVAGGEDALNALQGQTNDYVTWLRATVLPQARTETKLPPALYADALKRVGIDIDAQSSGQVPHERQRGERDHPLERRLIKHLPKGRQRDMATDFAGQASAETA